MAKEDMRTLDGVVQEVLPNTQFRVEMANARRCSAYASARCASIASRILAGDKVSLEISPYDLTRAASASGTRTSARCRPRPRAGTSSRKGNSLGR